MSFILFNLWKQIKRGHDQGSNPSPPCLYANVYIDRFTVHNAFRIDGKTGIMLTNETRYMTDPVKWCDDLILSQV